MWYYNTLFHEDGHLSRFSIYSISCNSFYKIECISSIFFNWQPTQEGSWSHEAYLLFPVHLDGTLLDNAKAMKAKKESFSTSDVLQIFRQVNKTVFNVTIYLTLLFSSIEQCNFSLDKEYLYDIA